MIQLNTPTPLLQKLKQIAKDEHLTLAALCRRVLALYVRDPLAFHATLFENQKKAAAGAPGQSHYE